MAAVAVVAVTLGLLLGEAGADCAIRDPNITTSSNSAWVHWDISPECDKDSVVQYNVTWRHVKYNACIKKTTNERSYESVLVLAPAQQLHIQDKLEAFSTYDLEIGVKELSLKWYGSLETAASSPEMHVVSSRPRLPTESYSQALRFHWPKPDCRFQYGRHQDYLVELEGLDPWAAGAVELVAGNTTVDESIYVPGLQAFTSYLLRVFGRNQGGLVSRVPLDIRATTRATVPEPPDNIQLKAISCCSVHLSWTPAHPPTGDIARFEVGYRQEARYWSSPTEVSLLHQGACVEAAELRSRRAASASFCYVFNDLRPATIYGFRIRAFNRDVEEASEWSAVVAVTTQAAPTTAPPLPAPASNVTAPAPAPTPRPAPPAPPLDLPTNSSQGAGAGEEKEEASSYHTLTLVVGLLFGLVFLGVTVTALVYKLKIVRLKQQMRSEELWNHGRDPGELSHSVSYVGGASTSTRFSDLNATYSTYATISAASLNTSFAAAEIQARRLPEPPPGPAGGNRAALVTEPEYCYASYELEALPGPGPGPGPGYLDMSRSPSRRHSATLESTRIQEELQEEECTDTEGYLRPTFPNTDLLSPVRPPDTEPGQRRLSGPGPEAVIEPESYEVPGDLRPRQPVIDTNPPDLVRLHPPPAPAGLSSLEPEVGFERSEPPRLSQTSSLGSSKRNSPSEPLIKAGQPPAVSGQGLIRSTKI